MSQHGCLSTLAALALLAVSLLPASSSRALARGGHALPDGPSACLGVEPAAKDLTQPIRDAVDASFEEAKRDGDLARFLGQTETTLDVGAGLSTSDFWHDTGGGGRVWCLQVQTDTYRGTSLAGSLKLVFGALAAPDGAETRVYDDEGDLLLGPYQGSEPGGFTTDAVVMREEGRSSLLVAHYEPPSARGASALRLDEVVYGFSNTTRLGMSYSNHISASTGESCSGSAAWASEIRATVSLKSVNRAGGHTSGRTGVLVNNTEEDLAPLVLTAAHVVAEDVGEKLNDVGNRNFFLINYQSAACDAPEEEEPPYYAVTGGTVVAKDAAADFALIELPERIPPAYRAHYAGWSLEEDAPRRAVAIGHPRGDAKKISFEEDALPGHDDARWHPVFDKGTIQGGHSGAPLFDENHRLRGHLTRVGHRRYAPVPATGPRLSAIWDVGAAGERVRDYLAPGGGSSSQQMRVASVAGYDLRVRGETFADPATDLASGFFRTAGRIDVADATVEAGGRLTLRAREGIRIKAPFRAEAGSRFKARLDEGPALSDLDFPAAAPAALADAGPNPSAGNASAAGSAPAESNAAEDSVAAPGGQAEASSHALEKAKTTLARSERPEAFALHPPYPNPSGGRVTLRYALPEAARVELAVFDMLGRRVATPVAGRQQPARMHRLAFDATALASGTYLVRLRAGEFTGTQTLVLVR